MYLGSIFEPELRVGWDGTQKMIPWDKLLKSVPWDGKTKKKVVPPWDGTKKFSSHPIPWDVWNVKYFLRCQIYLIIIDRLRLRIIILLHVTFHDFIKMKLRVWISVLFAYYNNDIILVINTAFYKIEKRSSKWERKIFH